MSEKLNFRKIVAYLFCITLIAILLHVCRNQNHLLKAVQTFYSARLFLYISWGEVGVFLQIMVFQHKKADNNIKNLKIIQSQISSLLCNTVLRKLQKHSINVLMTVCIYLLIVSHQSIATYNVLLLVI